MNKNGTLSTKSINKSWLFLSLLSFIGFTTFAIGVVSKANWLTMLDQSITDWIRGTITSGKSAFYIPITHFGSSIALILFTVIVCLWLILIKKDWANSIWIVINLAIGSGLVNIIAKHIFLRPRPTIQHLIQKGGYSFPSGHSMGSFVFYSSIAFILIYYVHSKVLKWIIAGLAVFMILSIGLSRIYVGVHFPSDVLAGYCLAAAWMFLSIGYHSIILSKLNR